MLKSNEFFDGNLLYRKATAEDIDIIADIRCEFLAEVNGEDFDRKTSDDVKEACLDYFGKAVADGSFIAWIAEISEEIIATSGICFYTVPPNKSCPNGSVAFIQNMYTKKEFRKRGIAKKLFEKMLEEANIHGCTKVVLFATDMGKPMYEKFGFKETKGDMALHL